jgi:hypothetical protein
MAAYDPFLRVVSNMLSRYGGDGVLISRGDTPYNYSTSTQEQREDCYPLRMLAFDFLQKKDGDRPMQNTLIQSGDKQIYMSAGSWVPRPIAGVDEIVYNSRVYSIVTVKELNPSGSTTVYTEMFIRE